MMPDKVYLEEGHAEPIVGFVGPAWNNPKDLENPIEFIRKDALLEWANKQLEQYVKLQYAKHQDPVHWGQRNAFQQVIDKLNEM